MEILKIIIPEVSSKYGPKQSVKFVEMFVVVLVQTHIYVFTPDNETNKNKQEKPPESKTHENIL